VTPPSLGQSPRERPVNFVIVTSASYEELQQVTSSSRRTGQKSRADQRRYRPQAEQAGTVGRVKRDKAADLGVPVETIGRTLETCSAAAR
jgi:multidrug efflux pump